MAIIGAYGSAGAALTDGLADEEDVDLTVVDDGDPSAGCASSAVNALEGSNLGGRTSLRVPTHRSLGGRSRTSTPMQSSTAKTSTPTARQNTAAGRARLVVAREDSAGLLHYHADVMAKTMQLAVEMELSVHVFPDTASDPTTPEILDGLAGDAAAALYESSSPQRSVASPDGTGS